MFDQLEEEVIQTKSSNIIEIKQLPDVSAMVIGLQKYNKSKLPNTFDIVYPGKGLDNRFLTGIDEAAHDLIRYPAEKREEISKARREERIALQERLGIPDLSATSNYWLTYKVNLVKKEILNLDNPMDLLLYRVLIANGYLAPNLAAGSKPEHLHTKFYAHETAFEAKANVKETIIDDEVNSLLFTERANKTKLILVAKSIFGSTIKSDSEVDYVYMSIKNWLKTQKKQENSKELLLLLKATTSELSLKLTVTDAIDLNVIRYREKLYQRGNITLGKTKAEVFANLMLDKFSNELQSITEEIEHKRKLG